MTDADMITVSQQGSRQSVSDLYSFTTERPKSDTTLGTTSDTTLIQSNFTDDVLTATVSRPLSTGDEYDAVLYEGIEMEFNYAWASGAGFSYHWENWGYGVIKLGSTQEDAWFDKFDKYGDEYREHGNYLTVLWLAVVPLAIVVIRYFKGMPYAFWIHAIVMLGVCIFTLNNIVNIYDTNEGVASTQTFDMREHSRSGLTLTALLVAQCMLGLLSKVFIMNKQRLYIVASIRRFHRVLGWTLLVTALYSLFNGWEIYDEGMLDYIILAYIGLVVLFGVLELREILRHHYPCLNFYLLKQEDKKNEGESKPLLKCPSQYNSVALRIVKDKKKWSFYEEYVLDLSQFMYNHPGGKRLIKGALGQDLGKYLNGCSSAPGLAPFPHPEHAKAIAEQLVVAYIGFASDVLVATGVEGHEQMRWVLRNKYKVSRSTTCLELTSPNWKLCRPNGVSWMGKHFLVKGPKTQSRYYSLVACDMEVWRDEVQQEGFEVDNDPGEHLASGIRLHIKPYAQGTVSTYLTDLPQNKELLLKGPMGPGLMLETLPSQPCIALAGGTGVLPFIDLLYYIWEGSAPEGFALYFYVSFMSYDDAFALDLFKALAAKCPEYFRLHINVSRDAPDVMSLDKLQAWVDLSSLNRAWVCGTSGFNYWVKDMLAEAQFNVSRKLVIL